MHKVTELILVLNFSFFQLSKMRSVLPILWPHEEQNEELTSERLIKCNTGLPQLSYETNAS